MLERIMIGLSALVTQIPSKIPGDREGMSDRTEANVSHGPRGNHHIVIKAGGRKNGPRSAIELSKR
jgi:hypothetical protein